MKAQFEINRRKLLQAATGLAGAFLVPGSIAFADGGRTVSLRIDKEVKNLDPPFRAGNVDGNVIHAIFQGLISRKKGEFDWQLDAAESIEQVSPTEIAFRLKKGQMFTDGYGELTAEDVKFSLSAIWVRIRTEMCQAIETTGAHFRRSKSTMLILEV